MGQGGYPGSRLYTSVFSFKPLCYSHRCHLTHWACQHGESRLPEQGIGSQSLSGLFIGGIHLFADGIAWGCILSYIGIKPTRLRYWRKAELAASIQTNDRCFCGCVCNSVWSLATYVTAVRSIVHAQLRAVAGYSPFLSLRTLASLSANEDSSQKSHWIHTYTVGAGMLCAFQDNRIKV